MTGEPTMEKGKPEFCPFCGEIPAFDFEDIGGEIYSHTVTPNCPLAGWSGPLEEWNRRAPAPTEGGKEKGYREKAFDIWEATKDLPPDAAIHFIRSALEQVAREKDALNAKLRDALSFYIHPKVHENAVKERDAEIERLKESDHKAHIPLCEQTVIQIQEKLNAAEAQLTTYREALKEAGETLKHVREACRAEPAMNNRKYDALGLEVIRATDKIDALLKEGQ